MPRRSQVSNSSRVEGRVAVSASQIIDEIRRGLQSQEADIARRLGTGTVSIGAHRRPGGVFVENEDFVPAGCRCSPNNSSTAFALDCPLPSIEDGDRPNYWKRLAKDLEGQAIVIVVNTETVPGLTIRELKGLVQGNTIRAKHIGRDFMAGLKNLVGGELKGYTELMTEARRQALERMIAQAQQLGANAIVNARFTTSAVTQGAAELYAYGTAVVVE